MTNFIALLHFTFAGIFMVLAAWTHDLMWAAFAIVSSIMYLAEDK